MTVTCTFPRTAQALASPHLPHGSAPGPGGRRHTYTHTHTHTHIHTYIYTYHRGSHHAWRTGRTILGRRPPPWESLNRRRISLHSHSLYSHSHLRGRWTNCLIRTPSVELPNRTFALLLVRSCQVRKSEVHPEGIQLSMFKSSLSEQTPARGPHERASNAPVTRSHPRGAAGFTLSPSTGGTKTVKSTVICDVTTPERSGKTIPHELWPCRRSSCRARRACRCGGGW